MSSHSVFTIAPASLTLGAVLSRGSPGITLYKAELSLGQRTLQVAVKRLCTSGAPPAVEEAFLKEIQVLQLASGVCQRTCRMLGCCKLDGDPCIVMSLYPKSAVKLLQDHAGPLRMAEQINLGVEVLEGLAELHAANIWHLDLKPPNILLDQYGHAYLSDFGISYALRTLEACTALTSTAGTPHYMAPEQADADFGARGPHSDVWGFATTMLHLATGELPYKDLTAVQMLTAMIKGKPPSVPDTLPAWLQHLLKQCFAFDVAKRPPVPQLLQIFREQLNQGQSIPAASTSNQQMPASSALPPVSMQQNAHVQVQQQNGGVGQAEGVPKDGFAWVVADLQSIEAERRSEAAWEVYSEFLYGKSYRQAAMIAAGVVPPLLVAMLRADQADVQGMAESALKLIGGSEHKDAIIAAGAVPELVAMLSSHQPDMQRRAADMLGCLAGGRYASSGQRSRDAIIAAGAVPLLVAMLRSDALQQNAADALSTLAAGSQQNTDAVIAAGAMPLLVTMLRAHQPKVQEVAAAALGRLVYSSQHSNDAVIAAGAVPLLVALLRSNHADVQISAACALDYSILCWTAADALGNLAAGSQQSKDAVIAAGALPVLVTMLRSRSLCNKECAAKALKQFANGSQQSKAAVIAAGALPLLIALSTLDSDMHDMYPHLQGEAAEAVALLTPTL